MKMATRPNGPKGGFFFGSLRAFSRDPLRFVMECSHQYGTVSEFRLGPLRTMLITDPSMIEFVLQKGSRHFVKADSLRRGRPLLGNGLLTSEGDFWLRQRRLMAPAFHRDRIINYGQTMVDYTDRLLQTWQDGETRDIATEMSHLTMSVVTQALFRTEIGPAAEQVGQSVTRALHAWNQLIYRPPFTDKWPLPSNRRFHAAIAKLDEVIYGIIRERRASGEDHGDLLSMLIKLQDDDGSGMTEKQLRDEVITLFGAGHETTATTLSWACYALSQHPNVEERMAEELHSVLGDRLPTFDDIPRLRYTEMVVLETLRLFPAAWTVSREAVDDCEVGGYAVPKGTLLIVPQWVVHRDARYFPEPDNFIPDRWAGGLEKQLPHFAYFPFGGGPRICIGKAFAQMEAVLILAAVVQRYRLKLVPGQSIVPEPGITLRPKFGVKMELSKRT